MENLPQSKSELRRDMRSRRRALPETKRRQAAGKIAERLASLPSWRLAQRIAVYLANDGEIDPSIVVNTLRAEGRTPYLPVIQADRSLRFARWEAGEHLGRNRFGIPEPSGDPRPASELDVILLPLVAWDRQGNRLGMGGGFYDRALANAPEVLKVGLAYECQQVSTLPAQSWDVQLDFIVTESTLYNCQGDH
ncbi:5-formyltetrahydrofolate cyclo-ligase [Seongchinamella unica]|uniref:5-formyltetrahydrofolate cyclo-ligase n=1 Tax=Seongchinamella unica TaxID=2547392 RepID=A0A4V2ZXM3_9GAMM|nr:5-formyltetrahydrofolate cyclo-ligase [Seongchinamella unica]TDG15565.1 5-formyltetrahydrofolate cyclo-ligase [Seongchinamella unica]